MRSYQVYRNIRKGAVIWGLPISLFALLMASVICSLLVIIFSFSLLTVLGLFLWNGGLFVGLVKWRQSNRSFQLGTPFPKNINNKQVKILHYVDY